MDESLDKIKNAMKANFIGGMNAEEKSKRENSRLKSEYR